MTTHSSSIESHLQETRTFNPPKPAGPTNPAWHVHSLDAYHQLHQRALDDPHAFWADVANELHWFKPFTETYTQVPTSPAGGLADTEGMDKA